jgi:hypothetical protein
MADGNIKSIRNHPSPGGGHGAVSLESYAETCSGNHKTLTRKYGRK